MSREYNLYPRMNDPVLTKDALHQTSAEKGFQPEVRMRGKGFEPLNSFETGP